MGLLKKPINTELYYCKSRYYIPQWCRWLTADSINYLDPASIVGLNLFSYCYNEPLISIDENGTWSWKRFWSCVGIATIAAVVGTYTAAGLAVAGIAAFAGAEIQQEISGQNYMSWLGGAYDSVKGAAYAVPFALPMLAAYAPPSSTNNSSTGCYLIKRGDK